MQPNAPVTPEIIFQTLTGFQHSYALKAAIDLDIFTKIGEGKKSIADIAKAIDASERGTRVLCDGMTVLGFLSKENGEYGLTEIAAEFLDRNAQKYIGDAVYF